MKRKKKRELAHFGPSRGGVRVVLDRGVILVLWPPRKQRTYPDTPEGRVNAVAHAQGLHDGTAAKKEAVPVKALTVGELWAAYGKAEFPSLRPRTQKIMASRWAKFEAYKKHDFPAADVTFQHMDEFREALEKRGRPGNQIKLHVQVVKLVYRWARQRKLVLSDVPDYRLKMAKEQRALEPDEYVAGDFDALVATLDPRKANEWRPWCALMLIGHQGVRVNAALHCAYPDDVVGERLIWRPEWDKLGRQWDQPIRDGALSAILWALWWRERLGYAGRWLIFTARPKQGDKPYRVQALWRALQEAEKRAGVRHKPWRALHGLRRMVAGDVLEETGDFKAALDFIGDRDPRLLQKYLKVRENRRTEVAKRMDERAQNNNVMTTTGSA